MTRIKLPNERQVGHLTLLRQGRQIATNEYNALAQAERLELVRQAQGKKKYQLLINAKDAEQLVVQLHPQELYLTINELGSEDSVELLTLASAEQITTLIDLDCWDGDTLSPLLSLHWLQLLLDTGPEKVCQLAEQLEPEILALFLKKHLTIIRGLEVYDDDDAENAKRLESLYDVDYASEDAAKIIGALLRILMEQAQEQYLLLMEMVRSELKSTLEEEVYQSRNNRLADFGFLPASEAKALYGYIDPEHFTLGGKSDYRLEADELQYPGALLAQASPENLLAEVLTNRLDHHLATELCMLANRKMSADNTDISAPAEIGRSLQDIYDTLNLALEHQAGTDVSRAEQVVETSYLLQLYQLGHSLLQQLTSHARQLLSGPLAAYFDYPEQLFLDALSEQPPVLYCEAYADQPSRLQAINTLKRHESAKERLRQVDDLQRLFCEQLPFQLPATDEAEDTGLSLSVFLLTAVANQLLGRGFSPTPLAVEDLILLKAQTLKNGELLDNFTQEVHSITNRLNLNCPVFIDFCLQCWQEDLHIVDLDNLTATDQLSLLIETE